MGHVMEDGLEYHLLTGLRVLLFLFQIKRSGHCQRHTVYFFITLGLYSTEHNCLTLIYFLQNAINGYCQNVNHTFVNSTRAEFDHTKPSRVILISVDDLVSVFLKYCLLWIELVVPQKKGIYFLIFSIDKIKLENVIHEVP